MILKLKIRTLLVVSNKYYPPPTLDHFLKNLFQKVKTSDKFSYTDLFELHFPINSVEENIKVAFYSFWKPFW